MATFEWTNSLKKQVTQDWHYLFPEYTIYKHFWLIRKVGCMILGIILKTSKFDREYEVLFHTHNLLRSASTLSLELSFHLLTERKHFKDSIDVINHSKVYKSVGERFIEQNPIIIIQKNIDVEIQKMYSEHLKNYLTYGGSHPAILMESLLMINGYYNSSETDIETTLHLFDTILNNAELDKRGYFDGKFNPEFQKDNLKRYLTELAENIINRRIDYEQIIKENCKKLKIHN